MKYKIGKFKFKQEELTWGQDKKLIDFILDKISKKAGDRELTLEEIKNVILEHDLIEDFLAIILIPVKNLNYYIFHKLLRQKLIDASKLQNSKLMDIFEDFFLINQEFLKKLSGFGEVFGLIAQAMTMNRKQKSKQQKTSSKVKQKKEHTK